MVTQRSPGLNEPKLDLSTRPVQALEPGSSD